MLLFVGIFVITSIIVNSDVKALKIAKAVEETPPPSDDAATKEPGTLVFPSENAELQQTAPLQFDCQAVQTLFSTLFHQLGDSMKNAKAAVETMLASDDAGNVNGTDTAENKPAGENVEGEAATEGAPTDVKEAAENVEEEKDKEEEKKDGGQDE